MTPFKPDQIMSKILGILENGSEDLNELHGKILDTGDQR